MMKTTEERHPTILTRSRLLKGRAVAWIVTRKILTPLDLVVSYDRMYMYMHWDVSPRFMEVKPSNFRVGG